MSLKTNEWVVLLEFDHPAPSCPLEAGQVEQLLEKLREWHPSALYNPDRYVIQIQTVADKPCAALGFALGLHREAAASAGIPIWPVVRAEVMTPAELENDWSTAPPSASPVGPAVASAPDGPSRAGSSKHKMGSGWWRSAYR